MAATGQKRPFHRFVSYGRKMKYPTTFFPILITDLLLMPVGAYADKSLPDSVSAQHFVLNFYAWYTHYIDSDQHTPPVEYALKMKPQWFSRSIIKGLNEDEEAQAKSPDYIVGIDFDPFLNAQDTCEPHKGGKVTFVAHRYQVEVFCFDPKHPDVIAVVEKHGVSWIFVDFLYPGVGDLFSELEIAKKGREKTGK